jgi:hypothetical protein
MIRQEGARTELGYGVIWILGRIVSHCTTAHSLSLKFAVHECNSLHSRHTYAKMMV